MERFNTDEVIRILGLEIRAELADGGQDFDVACRIALSMIHKAQHYEDLAEQGRLLELPCKIGDTVYKVVRYRRHDEHIPVGVEETVFSVFMHDAFGETIFLTKSEADQALKKYEDTGLTPQEIMDGKLLTGWIPVEERLPADGVNVLITTGGRGS